MSQKDSNNDHVVIIDAHSNRSANRLSEIWDSRHLIELFVKRDFVTFYKQTILGPFWFVVQPLVTTVTFTVIFGEIAKIPTNGVPPFIFYMPGIIIWGYFSLCLDKTSRTFIENQAVFSKVYFPRLAVPLAFVISNLTSFLIQFVTFIAFLVYFSLKGEGFHFQWTLWLLPIVVLQAAIFGLSIGLIVSALTIKYRDLNFITGFGVTLMMYASPVIYPFSEVPEKWRLLASINPMTGVIEVFRSGFMNAGKVYFEGWFLGMAVTVATLCIGLTLFFRAEKTFVDTV
jgi:lipopolysaccharide transport system permease protein